jgi:hypothetical protein
MASNLNALPYIPLIFMKRDFYNLNQSLNISVYQLSDFIINSQIETLKISFWGN